MPIKIQSELPAYEELISENIFVMTMDRAKHTKHKTYSYSYT